MVGITSSLGITGVIFIVIGIIMALISIIYIILNQNRSKAWYIWAILISGIVLAIIGSIMLAIALSQSQELCPCSTCTPSITY